MSTGLTRLFGSGLDALWQGDEPSPEMTDKLREQLRQENEAKAAQANLAAQTQQVAQPSDSWMQAATGAHAADNTDQLEAAYQATPLDSIGHGFNNIMSAIDSPWEGLKNLYSSAMTTDESPMAQAQKLALTGQSPDEDSTLRDIPINTSVGPGTVKSSPAHEQNLGISDFLQNTKQGQDEILTRGLYGEPEADDSAARKLARVGTHLGTGLATRASNTLPLAPGRTPNLRALSPILDVFASGAGTAGGLGALASGISGAHDTLPAFAKDPSIETGSNALMASLPALLAGHSFANLEPRAGVGHETKAEAPVESGNVVQKSSSETIPGFPEIPEGANLDGMNLQDIPFNPQDFSQLVNINDLHNPGGEAGAIGNLLGKEANEGNKRAQSFAESKLPHEQPVKVTFPDGEVHYDSVKGLNQTHALMRARENWDGALVEPVDNYKPNTETGAIGDLTGNKVKNLGPIPEQSESDSSGLWGKLQEEESPAWDRGELGKLKDKLFEKNKESISAKAVSDLTRHPAIKQALNNLAEDHGVSNPVLSSDKGYFHNFFSTDNPDLGLRVTKVGYDPHESAVEWKDSPDIIQPVDTRTVNDSKGKPLAQIDVVPKVDNKVTPTVGQIKALEARLAKQGLVLSDPKGSGENITVKDGKALVIDPGAVTTKEAFDNYEKSKGTSGPSAQKLRQPFFDQTRRSGREGFSDRNPVLGNFDRSSERGAIGDLGEENKPEGFDLIPKSLRGQFAKHENFGAIESFDSYTDDNGTHYRAKLKPGYLSGDGTVRLSEESPKALKTALDLVEQRAPRNSSEIGAIGDLSEPGYKSNADEVMKDLEESGLGDIVPSELSAKQKRTMQGTQLPNQYKKPIKVDQLFDPETGEDLSEVSQKLPNLDPIDMNKSNQELVAESLGKIRAEAKTETKAKTPVSESGSKPPGKPPKPPKPPSEPTAGEPEQLDEASKILPEDSFTQAWNKLTPGERAKEAWNTSRSAKAILDIPALRQGRVLTVNHPIEAGKSIVKAAKAGFSENEYKLVEKAIQSHPDYKIAKEAGLDLAGLVSEGKEEAFPAPLVEKLNVKIPDKVPLIGGKEVGPGKVIRGSERAYSAYMNPMRIHAFSKFKAQLDSLNDAGKLGKGKFSEEGMKPFYQDAARAVNVLSMRGDIRSSSAKAIVSKASSIIWSPRNKIAQAQILKDLVWNDFNSATSARFKRYVGTNVALNAALLGLATAAGAKVETDPESSDWGKAKFGDIRWNPWGPMQGLVRNAILLKTGERKTIAGQTRKTSVGDVFGTMFKNSLHPSLGTLIHQIDGKSFSGKDITDERFKALADDQLTPLVADDAYSAAKKYGLLTGGLVYGASTLSEDVRTYTDDRSKTTKKSVKKKKSSSSTAYPSLF